MRMYVCVCLRAIHLALFCVSVFHPKLQNWTFCCVLIYGCVWLIIYFVCVAVEISCSFLYVIFFSSTSVFPSICDDAYNKTYHAILFWYVIIYLIHMLVTRFHLFLSSFHALSSFLSLSAFFGFLWPIEIVFCKP